MSQRDFCDGRLLAILFNGTSKSLGLSTVYTLKATECRMYIIFPFFYFFYTYKVTEIHTLNLKRSTTKTRKHTKVKQFQRAFKKRVYILMNNPLKSRSISTKYWTSALKSTSVKICLNFSISLYVYCFDNVKNHAFYFSTYFSSIYTEQIHFYRRIQFWVFFFLISHNRIPVFL